jgi:hypothetical protein
MKEPVLRCIAILLRRRPGRSTRRASSNMTLLGHQDLQGAAPTSRWSRRQGPLDRLHRPSRRQDRERAHRKREDSGTSIVDVTDPRKPRYLAHIPGEPGQGERAARRWCASATARSCPRAIEQGLPAAHLRQPRARSLGRHRAGEARAHRVVVDKLKGTHKNWWECDTGIAYLVSGLPDWRTRRMTQIFDLSDPAQPRFIRNFGLAGQEPGATGPVPTELHGPISTGPKGQSRLFRLWHQQVGCDADRRPAEAPRRPA